MGGVSLNLEEFKEICDNYYIEQYYPEFFEIIKEVNILDPLNVIMEIGVMKGGTLKVWEQMLKPKDLLIGVDWGPDIRGKVDIQWDWRRSDRNIVLIIGNSEDPNTIKKVEEALNKRKIDFLLIDGGHGDAPMMSPYVRGPCIDNLPKRDFENYVPFVRSGGLVDVADLGEPCCNELFESLVGRKKKYENRGSHGLWWKP